jgi:hypothetical protein
MTRHLRCTRSSHRNADFFQGITLTKTKQNSKTKIKTKTETKKDSKTEIQGQARQECPDIGKDKPKILDKTRKDKTATRLKEINKDNTKRQDKTRQDLTRVPFCPIGVAHARLMRERVTIIVCFTREKTMDKDETMQELKEEEKENKREAKTRSETRQGGTKRNEAETMQRQCRDKANKTETKEKLKDRKTRPSTTRMPRQRQR